ncbi:hypothetical protein C8Q74DRAFT_1213779 [Fomes fomentarius]|nr:hypothetical protein C8Q74DRAFT_1213779 [Fomes fomentarius]
MGTHAQTEPSPTGLPYDDISAPSLPHGMPALAVHDQWPTNLPWPVTTEIHLADAWHNYVPQSIDQATALMRKARDQQGGALQRLVTDPAHPEQVPPLDMTEGYMLMRRFVPPTGKSEGLQRAQLLAVIVHVFSVLDFYKCMVMHHHLRVATTEDLRPVPGPIANVREINVLCWAVQCGMTHHTLLLISNVARWCHNQDLGRALDSMEVWPNFPSSLEDVPTYVAPLLTATSTTNPVEPSSAGLTPQEDVEMTGEGSAQTEQPAVDAPAGGICSEATIDLVKDATTIAHPYEMTTVG